jgi:hypothetical protein
MIWLIVIIIALVCIVIASFVLGQKLMSGTLKFTDVLQNGALTVLLAVVIIGVIWFFTH